MDLTIHSLPTSKDDIIQPPLAEMGVIPRTNTSSIFNGSSGTGKSTLMANLLTREEMYPKDTWKFKLLISPTAEGDDVQKHIGLKYPWVVSDLKKAPKILKSIMSHQLKVIKQIGAAKAPQYLIIYDDVVSDPDFVRSDEFVASFIRARHYNFTTWLGTQSWTATPRRCRLQATNVFFFAGSQSEIELLANEYTPTFMVKKQFFKLVQYATDQKYFFLYINKSLPLPERYHKNLNEKINIEYFQSLDPSATNLVDDQSETSGAQLNEQNEKLPQWPQPPQQEPMQDPERNSPKRVKL